MPRSLTNAYWIHVGEVRERQRIIKLLQTNRDVDKELIDSIIDLIRGDIDV